MGKFSEQQSAARQFYADAPRPKTARDECEEDFDDPVGQMLDEWTEKLMRNGDVPRLYAQRCAAAVVGVLRERDQGLQLAQGESPVRGDSALLEGLRMLAIKQYQAPKPRLSAGCLLLAMGEAHPDFRSARELAEKQQVSHELAANGVEDWQQVLGLPRTSGQKSAEALKIYQDTNGKTKRAA